MKRIVPIVMLVTVLGCNQTKVDKMADGEKIMQLSKDWSQTVATKDLEKIVSYWADDAFVMQPGQPPLKGKQAIRQMVEESFKIPGFSISWQPESVEVSDSGDMAYMIENAQVTFTDSTGKQVIHHNKAVSIWRKQADGSWKNAVDISTPDPSQKK